MKRIIKAATNDSIPENIREFSKKIDFSELNRILSDKLGIEVNLVPGEITKGYSGYYIPAEMKDNIVSECGILSSVLKSVKLILFNSVITTDNETGELYFWCTPHFRYEIKEGGSNGLGLCAAFFTESDGWDIRW